MKADVYLILNRFGVQGFRKSKPSLTSGQIAVKVKLDVSDKYFDRFIPETSITLEEHQALKPEISVSVADPTMDKLLEGKK